MSERTPQRLCILGATGSIGGSTLDVVARHPDRYQPCILTANRDVDGMRRLCQRFQPRCAVMSDPAAANDLDAALGPGHRTTVLGGEQALADVVVGSEVDTVVAGIVGAAGLASCLAAAEAGKRLLIANKEALVVAGDLIMAAARRSGATVLPIDSEHNGLFQCLPSAHGAQRDLESVERLILTASGGPFRDRPVDTLGRVTVNEACAHPTWRMGRKISVDSATMMNKGLEVIEAARFFGIPGERIEVLIHPQSLVHGLVSYRDGSMLAQLGQPDMRTPIAHALAWPERVDAGVAPLDLARAGSLAFETPDPARFPCLRLAREALAAGGASTAALNAANEVAVAAFLAEELGFDRIAAVIQDTLNHMVDERLDDLDALMQYERAARRVAAQALERQRR